ncbi:hypothetical protein GALMADRAFT_239668 [Galerina marginata CBS 339.88]|uniref:Uncharacterized protein n=1 Tax=Galerina marginata (strain CBS 339.88) TaxID=685588 RepID=A0A067TNW6_GALM3|nr:hypothetical protein GALMADRAFT_239668 [Galerina marginata CBS 339.88]
MSDKQKATLSLTLVQESCTAALSALSESVHDPDYPTAAFSTLRTDFLSLLSILYAATTKVALSLKPSAPHHKASLIPLKDLSNNVAALVHSIRLMRLQEGVTVLEEYVTVARNVISAIRSLSQTLLQDDEANPTEEYLIRTGEVHELIENVRKSGGLSLNNRDAVRRLWARELDSLLDGYAEIQEICKPSESSDQDVEEEDAFDDGWEELGLSSDQKLSSTEADRAAKVQAIIKLVTLLQKKVIKDILSTDAAKRNNSTLDRLAPLSSRLLAASDDLISSMYAPQQTSNIKLSLEAFCDTTKEISGTVMLSSDKTLEGHLESLSISTDDKSTKWFITCFDQIDKTATKILETLSNENETSS